MSSKKTAAADPFDVDFERDMPLTAADIEALARARFLRPLPTDEYLQWLSLMRQPHGQPPHRDNTDADEPFTL
jgi:hypothetical protein